jgi:long-chain acyl-CoA synthetase
MAPGQASGVAGFVGDWAQLQPERPAVVMPGRPALTYRQLDERSVQIAAAFADAGLAVGDHIALLMESSARMLEVCWAAQRSGLYYTPISTRLSASDVAYIVADCGAKLFVTSSGLASVAGELVPLISGARLWMVDGLIDGYEALESHADPQPVGAGAIARLAELEGVPMIYSSGTTGRPKGIKRPLDPSAAAGSASPLSMFASTAMRFGPDTVYLCPAPLYHTAPLVWTMGVHRAGGTAVVMDHFDAESTLALIAEHAVTHAQFVPTMFVRMLKLAPEVRARYDLSSLRAILHAAAPCPPEVKRQMLEWLGPIVHELYGSTEGFGTTFIGPQDWLARPGSVGRCLFGAIHVLDDEGHELAPGEDGVLWFEAPNGALSSYHNAAEKTASSINDRGWATVWDVGHVDGDGFVYLTDRKANMVVSGGVNIYPQATEDLLISHPAVADAAVIGVPNADLGEELKAVVQAVDPAAAGPALAQELIDHCRVHLALSQCPRSVDFVTDLPREPNGKLLKRLVRDVYWEGRNSRLV